eukprot:TRINITY_DN8788_c0_g1_i3.p1 TRINITY_DN8788_c0_g1~~TRINITY_DN8788_c0_g1_i3.p1  ORF type:complete len:109 (-),score=11.44 TRINITY_DN8788_c0_g1_i3:366-692(-)
MKAAILVSLLFAFASAQCNITAVGDLSPECSFDTPWCTLQYNSTVNTACVECLSNCDCKPGQYCSSDPSTYRTCIEFEAEGKECFGYDNVQILDQVIPEDFKWFLNSF